MELNDYINADLTHSIHTTERRSFRGCRRRWDWIFHDGYYPLITPKPLEFGISYHKAMETWYDPDSWKMDREVVEAEAKMVFKRECELQLREYLLKTGNPLDEETQQDYDERVQLGLGMLTEYARTSRKLDAVFAPLYVEKSFEVPIKGPNGETIWCKCNRCWNKWCAYIDNVVEKDTPGWIPLAEQQAEERTVYWQGLPVTFGGRIDAIVRHLMTDRIWIIDWKTAARLSTGEPNAPDDFLYLDDQITGYLWALWSIGLDVAGFVYHEQKKAYPIEPEPLSRPRMGRMFSVNKNMDCDAETYERIVSQNDPVAYDAHLYDDHIEYLREFGGVFHKRHQIERNEHELRNAGLNLFKEAKEIVNPELAIYPSAGRFGCTFCAYQLPCLAKNRGDDYKYTLDTMYEKREKHYYQESSTDKPERG